MADVKKCLIIGLIICLVHRAESDDKGPKLINTLSDDEQNIGETCFKDIQFQCSPDFKYRLMNGGCNSLEKPVRGMAGSVFTRLLPALYGDKIRSIRTQKSGKELFSARVMSNQFCTEPKENPIFYDQEFTLNMMQWAQSVTHDVTGTSGKDGPRCCDENHQRLKDTPDNCEAIDLPTNDRFYSHFNRTCISMSRTKNTDDIKCDIGPVMPINMVTACIDASLLYGCTDQANVQIRLFQDGMMKFQDINGGMYPPGVKDPKSVCRIAENQDLCIQAGDSRANAHPMLAALQTVLLRLHNTIAKTFKELNPQWDDERLFQETRRLLIAIKQQITYKYFLPNLLGENYLQEIQCCTVKDDGYNNIYDPKVNPQILVEFTGSAFRCLHSTIVDRVVYVVDKNSNLDLIPIPHFKPENMCTDEINRVPVSEWKFSDFYLAVSFITEKENFEQLIVGMSTDLQGNIDRHFPTSITDKLFQVNGVGVDMESLDIEKGRDLGLSTFPKYLEMIGKPYPRSWEDYNAYMPANMIERLKRRYESPEDVELFIGGILENDAEGSHLGSVFRAIIAEQFCRLQKGDRFYFELGDQVYPFKPEQLQQIRKVTLSLIYCYTCPKLKFMQPDAFRKISDSNKVIPCKDIIGDFTLNPWKE